MVSDVVELMMETVFGEPVEVSASSCYYSGNCSACGECGVMLVKKNKYCWVGSGYHPVGCVCAGYC